MSFNDEEFSILNASMNRTDLNNDVYKSPSRLEQIKLIRFESTQKPLVIEMDSSEPYLIPTKSEKAIDLERENSFISINGNDDLSTIFFSNKTNPLNSSRAPIENFDFTASSRNDEIVPPEEVQNQIWSYCHEEASRKPISYKFHAFNADYNEIDNKMISRPEPGRKRLLNVIHHISDSNQAKPNEFKLPKLKQSAKDTFTGKKLAVYLEQNNMEIPSFLNNPNM